jgi:hypothetical protein
MSSLEKQRQGKGKKIQKDIAMHRAEIYKQSAGWRHRVSEIQITSCAKVCRRASLNMISEEIPRKYR